MIKEKKKQNHAEEIIELENVLNIHNDSGIKDLPQIEAMVKKIQPGSRRRT